jgi:hypothetical protein
MLCSGNWLVVIRFSSGESGEHWEINPTLHTDINYVFDGTIPTREPGGMCL